MTRLVGWVSGTISGLWKRIWLQKSFDSQGTF